MASSQDNEVPTGSPFRFPNGPRIFNLTFRFLFFMFMFRTRRGLLLLRIGGEAV